MRSTSPGDRHGRRERGAVGLEWAGIIAVAVLVVGLVGLAVSGPFVGRAVSTAVCQVFSLGQGDCGSAQADPGRAPTEPCVTGEQGWSAEAEGVFTNFGAGGGRAATIETLSNGKYRVTVTDSSSGRVETGVGWDARVEINGTRWGSDMGAGAQGKGTVTQANVFEVGSREHADDIVYRSIYDANISKAQPEEGNFLSDASRFFVDPVTDTVSGWMGLEEPPDPSSKVFTAGASVEASAWITPWVGGLEAKAGMSSVLGVQEHADGTHTVMGEANAELVGQGAISIEKGQVGLDETVVISANFDGQDITSVTVTRTSTSTDGDTRTVTATTLDAESDADSQALSDVMHNPDPRSWQPFFDRAADHGDVTRLTYDDSASQSYKAAGEVWFIEGLGANGGLSMPNSSVTKAEYFDGAGFADWEACTS